MHLPIQGGSIVGKSLDEKLALKVSKLKAELKNLRERLLNSEEKYKDIIENIEDGCGECDLAGNFTFTNTALRNILGYSKDELLGMNYRKYMDEGMAEKVYQKFNKAYRTGMPDKGFDYEIIRKDGILKFPLYRERQLRDETRNAVPNPRISA